MCSLCPGLASGWPGMHFPLVGLCTQGLGNEEQEAFNSILQSWPRGDGIVCPERTDWLLTPREPSSIAGSNWGCSIWIYSVPRSPWGSFRAAQATLTTFFRISVTQRKCSSLSMPVTVYTPLRCLALSFLSISYSSAANMLPR